MGDEEGEEEERKRKIWRHNTVDDGELDNRQGYLFLASAWQLTSNIVENVFNDDERMHIAKVSHYRRKSCQNAFILDSAFPLRHCAGAQAVKLRATSLLSNIKRNEEGEIKAIGVAS